MAYIKSPEEREAIKEGGKILGIILEELLGLVQAGKSAKEIDDIAEQRIREAGGVPAFKGYKTSSADTPFPSTLCFSINEEVVHGIAAADKIISDGDLVTLDIGMRYPANGGYFTDTAASVYVGEVPEKIKQLMAVTKKAMNLGIAQAKPGNTVADISRAIEDYLEPQGYGIVRDLCGHGVGHAVHEDPNVLNYYEKRSEQWVLQPGVVIAIEPMVTLGDYRVNVADDGWGIVTSDGSLSCHFEHTVVIEESGPVIATKRPSEK